MVFAANTGIWIDKSCIHMNDSYIAFESLHRMILFPFEPFEEGLLARVLILTHSVISKP